MPPVHAKRCRYCREPVGPSRPATWDHFVPRWVLRAYPARFTNHAKGANKVTACRPCNLLKGLVPAAEFVAVRLFPEKQRESYLRWARICLAVNQGQVEEHRELIYAEFSRPLPEHFPIGDRAVILAPAEREQQADWVKG